MRDGASWPAFYFDNFYSAFSAAEQDELLTSEAKQMAGDAYAGSMNYWNHSSGDLLHRLLYSDIKTYLVELLMKQDQMSMAASIESRVPFLDHRLVEFTASIPAKYATQGMAGKLILKAAVEDLLPHSIVYRKKMGFPTPWAYWLAGPFQDSLQRLLMEPRTLDRGLFRAEALRRLFAEHMAGHRDHGNRIWRLLNLELWFRVCVEHEPMADLVQPSSVVAYR
jgi:asparagine synthase (glutamine-hydrolysing)